MGKHSKIKIAEDVESIQNENTEHLSDNPKKMEFNNPDESKAVSTNKRVLDDSDGDSDQEVVTKKPKKKKKNNVPAEESASTNTKNKKSIRQRKREKYAERQALQLAQAKDQLKSQCLNYLSQWKHDRQNWKFMKAKQVWLYKNKFSKVLVPETSWPILLEYFESSQGNIRKMLLDDAKKIIEQMDKCIEVQDNNDTNDDNEESEDKTITKPDNIIYNRARSLIQCLQE